MVDLSSQIIKLKEKIDYYEFYAQFELEQMKPSSNNTYWANCPFHQEANPSFQINMTNGKYKCWSKCPESGGKGGDILDFWQHYYHVSYMKAVMDIAKWANFELELDEEYKEELEKKKELAKFNRKLMGHFQENLRNSQKCKDYLSQRGILKSTYETFRLGYFNPNTILDFIDESEYDIACKCGVLKRNDNGSVRPFSRHHRIMFPYLQNNCPLTFTSRALNGDDVPKYQNFNNNEFIKKEELVYGIDTAKDDICKKKYAFIVEGQFDCMKAWQKGIKNTVAVSGIQMTDSQILKLKKFTKRFFLIVEDRESAKHIKACNENINKQIPWSKIIVVKLYDTEKMDLDDYLSNHTTTEFFDVVRDSKSYNEFVVREALKDVHIRDIDDKIRFVSYIKSHLITVKKRIERDELVRKISEAIDMPIETIEKELRNKELSIQQFEYRGQAVKHDNLLVNIQKCLIALLFYDINVITIVQKYGENGIKKYMLPEYLELYEEITSSLDRGENLQDISTRLETDLTYKELFIECLFKLDVIILEEDELDEYLENIVELIESGKR